MIRLLSALVLLGRMADGKMTWLGNTTTLCYSCLSTHPPYVNFEDHRLRKYLEQKKIFVPSLWRECVEAEHWEHLNFSRVTKYMCESGVCVKLKGQFHNQQFVLRECWERLWDKEIDLTDYTESKCEPLDFLWDTMVEKCTCTGDLCNCASTIFHIFSIFLIPICTLPYFVYYQYH